MVNIFFTVFFSQILSVWGSYNLNLDKSQTGYASYYNNRFWSHKTSSGEKYNPYLFTAAHRFFPVGSWVQVIFAKTNKSTVVRVNDRGPFRKGTIIDLSLSAAKEIDLFSYGVSKVTIRLIPELEITDSLRSAWFKRDSINAKLHPFIHSKAKNKKLRKQPKKIKVK